MDRLKHIITVFAFLNCLFFYAQNNLSDSFFPSETVYVHCNTTTSISGETIYYKLYCLNSNDNTLSSVSKIGYVSLIDSNKQIIFQHKLFLENGMGYGDFFIPTAIPSGNYKLIGYTNWMQNNTKTHYFDSDITIINPFQINNSNANTKTSNKEEITIERNPSIETETIISNAIAIELNKSVFTNRDLVNLNISTSNIDAENGHYSISVKKIDDFSNDQPKSTVQFLKNNPTETLEKKNCKVLPELRGELIIGKVISKNENYSVNNIAVALSIYGNPFEFKLARTNAEGVFYITLDKPFVSSKLYLQIMDDYRENYSIQLDKSSSLDFSKSNFTNFKNLNISFKEKLQERSIASQIENAYYTKKADSIAKIANYKPFYNSKQKDYILNDYTRFNTLKETITEVVKEMYYTFDNNKYAIHLRDYVNFNEVSQKTLVLIDGLVIQDENELFSYDTRNIYKISIIQGAYYYGNSVFNGIVNIVTNNFDYDIKTNADFFIKPDIIRPLITKKYFTPNYTLDKNARIPDYRYQLLWQPNADLIKKSVSFYTSDITGKFEIQLEGFTEKGIPISVKQYFEVK